MNYIQFIQHSGGNKSFLSINLQMMMEPMSSTRSRLAIELLVDAFMQAEIQKDLIVLKSSYKSIFDTMFFNRCISSEQKKGCFYDQRAVGMEKLTNHLEIDCN